MTTQTIHIQTFDYGSSLTSATLRNVSTDVTVATADSVNEVTADSGLYAAVFGEASVIAAGTYRLRAIVGGQPINRYVTLAGINNEVVQSSSVPLLGEILAAAQSAGGGAGTGARTITVTVTDDLATPLQNATVRFTEGANTFVASTNSSGVKEFNLNDATYTVAITKDGFQYSGGILVVSANAPVTYVMTRNTPIPVAQGHIARRAIPVTVIDRID